jgi:hypothetical protein
LSLVVQRARNFPAMLACCDVGKMGPAGLEPATVGL